MSLVVSISSGRQRSRRRSLRADVRAIALAGLVALAASPVLVALAASPALAGQAPPAQGFADLVERLTPAVVNIASTLKSAGGGDDKGSQLKDIPPGAPGEEFFDHFGGPPPEQPEGSLPFEDGAEGPQAASLGSGFIIDEEGYVVTNNHVIADSEDISVVLDDGSRLKAKVIGRDTKTDLALLKVEAGRPLAHVQFGDSDGARVGDWVIAVGNPFGLGNSVSAGIVSARGRDINAGPYDDFLQTDAPINRGNSGGPMFDLEGKVIGVNTLIYSPSGGSVGIGFATPAAIVKPVIEQLKKYGATRRGWIGVRIQTVSDELANKLGLAPATGALVAGVIEQGPAEAAGVKISDVIIKFDGKMINSRRTLPRLAADTEIGRTVELVVWREKKEVTLTLAVARLEDYEKTKAALSAPASPSEQAAPAQPEPAPPPTMAEANGILGVTLAELDPANRARYGVGPDVSGVVVTAVDAAGAGAAALTPGDVIVELDRQAISNLIDLRAALNGREADRPVVVLRQRAEEREFVVIEPNQAPPQG